MNRKIKKALMLSIAVLLLFVLSCAPRAIRPIQEKEVFNICSRAVPEFPLVARVGVRLKESGENKGAVAGLLYIKDRETFKIALLGPFGSQVGEFYFLSGRLVAYKDKEKVLDTVLPIEGLPVVANSLKGADLKTEDKKIVLAGEVKGRRFFCRIDPKSLEFESLEVHDGVSTLSLQGFRDGFYKRIVITKGDRKIEIRVRQVNQKKSLRQEIFLLPQR